MGFRRRSGSFFGSWLLQKISFLHRFNGLELRLKIALRAAVPILGRDGGPDLQIAARQNSLPAWIRRRGRGGLAMSGESDRVHGLRRLPGHGRLLRTRPLRRGQSLRTLFRQISSQFDLSGMVLNFNLSYQGLQPIDSSKFSWIDWAQLDVIDVAGETSQVRLWDHALLVSGNYSVAQGTFTFSAPGGCTVFDRLTLFVNNAEFDFVANGGESAADVARWFASAINSYDWWAFQQSSVSVIAFPESTGELTLKNARAGRVNVAGTEVSWYDGVKFPGIAAGSTFYLGGAAYAVARVNSATSLSLSTAAPTGQQVPYLAEYGGSDGNGAAVYMVVRPGNVTLQLDNPLLQLAGGNSDNVVWNISLDFSALGIDQIRQAWLTFAPRLPDGGVYKDTEWTAIFSDWSIFRSQQH